jgi:hypothetical protein
MNVVKKGLGVELHYFRNLHMQKCTTGGTPGKIVYWNPLGGFSHQSLLPAHRHNMIYIGSEIYRDKTYRDWAYISLKTIVSGLILCWSFSVVARSYVPNSYSNYSFIEETRADSQQRHVSLGTSSLGWKWPWSSLFIVLTLTWTVLLDKYLQVLDVLAAGRCIADA